MNELFKKDFYRLTKKDISIKNFLKYMCKCHEVRYLYFYRKNSFISKIIKRKMKLKYGLEKYRGRIIFRTCVQYNC